MFNREAAAAQRAPEWPFGEAVDSDPPLFALWEHVSCAVGALSLARPSLHRGCRVIATPEPDLDIFPP